jgi:hypothetical protein
VKLRSSKNKTFPCNRVLNPSPSHRTAIDHFVCSGSSGLGRACHRGGHRHARPRALPCGQVLSRHWGTFQGWIVKGRSSWILRLSVVPGAKSMQSETIVLGRIKHNDHLLSSLKVALRSLSPPPLDHVLYVPALRLLEVMYWW